MKWEKDYHMFTSEIECNGSVDMELREAVNKCMEILNKQPQQFSKIIISVEEKGMDEIESEIRG